MMRRLLIVAAKIGLLVVSLSISLVIGEVALRALGYQAIFEVYSKPSVLWQHDEVLGWSHEPGTEAKYIGPRPWPIEFDSPVSINSLGLRGPEIAPLPEDGVRILVLGDSMVAGFEVDYEETFVAQMEAMLTASTGRPVQVVNAGVRGYGTDQSLLYYRHRGHLLDPDIVLMWLSVNDLVNDVTIHRMRRIFGKPAFVAAGADGLELVGAPVPQYPDCSEYRVSATGDIVRLDSPASRLFCRVQMELFDRSALFSFLTHLVPWDQWGDLLRQLYYAGMPKPDVEPTAANGADAAGRAGSITDRILHTIAREVESRDSRFILTSTPQMLLRFEEAGVDLASFSKVPLEAVEAAVQEEVRFKHDSHLNAKGHRIVAEVLSEALRPIVEEVRAARIAVPTDP